MLNSSVIEHLIMNPPTVGSDYYFPFPSPFFQLAEQSESKTLLKAPTQQST